MKTSKGSVLTVAGSDSGGGAGIQADLKTFSAMGVKSGSVVTSITAQNSRGIRSRMDVWARLVTDQFDMAVRELCPVAIKTGMLGNGAVIKAVVRCLRRYSNGFLVVDPVMVSTSGHSLISARGREELVRRLLPLADLVTPNRREAEVLWGRKIINIGDAKEAARNIHRLCSGAAVLIKGGHFEGMEAVDLLYSGKRFREFRKPRIHLSGSVHGTGCMLSAAIAAGLARGLSLLPSISEAKELVTRHIAGGGLA